MPSLLREFVRWPRRFALPTSAADPPMAFGVTFQSPPVWAAAIAGVLVLQITLIATHIPWLDEWQALLIVEQSPSLAALLESLRYEGHPPLWYGLLALVGAAVSFDYVLPVASALVGIPLQALILLRAPFPRYERLLLALGEIALFEYGTIARSLALGALLMLATAALWRNRWVWLAIALLPLTGFLFGVVAVILVALRWRERTLYAPGLVLSVACGAIAAWSVRPASDAVPAEIPLAPLIELTDFLQRLGGLVVPFQTFLGRVAWDGFPPLLLGGPLGAVFVIWMWQRYAQDLALRAAMFALIGVCFALSVFVYPLHLRHLTVIVWLMVTLTWLSPVKFDREQARWRWWLAIGAVCGLATAGLALTRPFDAAPAVAAEVARLDDGRRPWLAFPSSRIPALASHVERPLVSPVKGCSETFVRWNHPHPVRTATALRRALPQWAATYGQSFLILEQLPRRVPQSVFRPLTGTMQGYNGQKYLIGVLGPDQPIRRRAFPPCVGGLRALP